MKQPLHDFGGRGEIIHLAVANGFPPQTYAPLLDPLTARYRVVSLPPRGLWGDEMLPEQFASWRLLADDLLAGMWRYDLTNVIAVGHSFGGVVSMLAVIADPARFRALVLLDPTLFLPGALPPEGRAGLAQGALRRRSRFANVEEAFAYWRDKSLFKDWSDEALRLYAASMTRPASDGQGLELAWSPAWEARYYETAFDESWDELPKLRGLLPVLVVRAANSSTFLGPAAQKLRQILPDAAYVELTGQGHLFPQAAPDETRAVIERWLSQRLA